MYNIYETIPPLDTTWYTIWAKVIVIVATYRRVVTLSLVDSIFEHRFYTFAEPLGDTPHILQILYLFPHGNTVGIAPTAAERTETHPQRKRDLVEEPDEFWNTPYPTSNKDKEIQLIWLNPKSIR